MVSQELSQVADWTLSYFELDFCNLFQLKSLGKQYRQYSANK